MRNGFLKGEDRSNLINQTIDIWYFSISFKSKKSKLKKLVKFLKLLPWGDPDISAAAADCIELKPTKSHQIVIKFFKCNKELK